MWQLILLRFCIDKAEKIDSSIKLCDAFKIWIRTTFELPFNDGFGCTLVKPKVLVFRVNFTFAFILLYCIYSAWFLVFIFFRFHHHFPAHRIFSLSLSLNCLAKVEFVILAGLRCVYTIFFLFTFRTLHFLDIFRAVVLRFAAIQIFSWKHTSHEGGEI